MTQGTKASGTSLGSNDLCKVEITEHRYGIPLVGLKEVQKALTLFMTGRTKSSHATRQQLDNDGDTGSMIGLLHKMVTTGQGLENQFLKSMFAEMNRQLQERGYFSEHYDYDGIGPFMKTTVTVDFIDEDNDIYLLALHAAYVGHQVEEGLAEALGIERGLSWIEVTYPLPSADDKFVVDCDDIADRLSSENLNWSLDGAELAKKLTQPNRENTNPKLVLENNGTYEVLVTLKDVAGFDQLINGEVQLTWTRSGNMVSGPLEEDPFEKGVIKQPKFLVLIRMLQHKMPKYIPAITNEVRQAMRQLALDVQTGLHFGSPRFTR